MTTSTSPDTMQDLVRFLIARIDEDDQQIRRLHRRRTRTNGNGSDTADDRLLERQRAECDAKRHILGQAQHLLVLRDLPSEKPVRDAAAHMLQALAEPYHDHYAYRPEWQTRS